MMATWALECSRCDFVPASDQTMGDVEKHWQTQHGGDEITLDLVPRCPDDGAAFDLSESGDSGQCPTCGRFEILRVPEQYR